MADISYSKKVNSSRFEDIIKEIIEIYGKGYITTKEIQPEKDEEKLCLKEVRLHGSRARGAGYRVRKVLSSEYEIIDIKENDQRFPEPTDPTILFLDLKDVPDYSNILTRIRNISKKQENTKLLLVDVNDQIKHEKGFSYSVEADYFLDKFDKDIDPAISRIVSELYLNVDYAVDPEGIVSTDGDLIKPYFKTSFLIEYDRSRDILEGLLSSVIRKFDPQIIASREIKANTPENEVRMYELAEPLAKKLGLESVMIQKNKDKYKINKNIHGKQTLLLEDVVGKGETKIKLINILRQAGGRVHNCIVLFDRKQDAKTTLKSKGINLYSLTDLDMYNSLVAEN